MSFNRIFLNIGTVQQWIGFHQKTMLALIHNLRYAQSSKAWTNLKSMNVSANTKQEEYMVYQKDWRFIYM